MELEILYICEKEYTKLNESFTQSVLHTHDHPEISIVFSGMAQYFINNKTYTLKAGELIILAPGIVHSVTIPKQNHYRDLHLGLSHLEGHLAECCTHFTDNFLIINFTETEKCITEICNALVEESNKRLPDYQMMLQSLIMRLLVCLSRRLDHSNTSKIQHVSSLIYPDKRAVVEWITDYIQQNYMKEISLEMFAKDMYLSQVYISKIFKEETGHSPIHFLIQTRLSIAKNLLENYPIPIKEVSRRVGYEDAYHFSKLFKKYYGYPPSEVKKSPHKA
ncbi:MAG: helix-turn-helix domain-containing protein [Cellulosilyticum sp.]|nr:helix-turn-helix domain-containing protein [Cellulosilyticum sp.]